MRVLGFDPGTAACGYGVVEGAGDRTDAVAYGVLRVSGAGTAGGLADLHRQATAVIARHRPQAVAVERLYFNRNARTALSVSQARGVLLLAAAQAGLPVAEYGPGEVKTAVTGYGAADKRQVQAMVRVLLSLPELPRPDDAADALAVALCALRHHRGAALAGEGR